MHALNMSKVEISSPFAMRLDNFNFEPKQTLNARIEGDMTNRTQYQIDQSQSFKTPEYQMVPNSLELIHSFLIFLLTSTLFTYILVNKKLRKKKSNQLFLNILFIHALSAIIIFVSNFCSRACVKICIIINNGLLIAMFESLIMLTSERLIAIKYSFGYLRVTSKHIFGIIVFSWMSPAMFVWMSVELRITHRKCLIVSTALIATATFTLTAMNIITYHIAKKHDRFVRENASRTPHNLINVTKNKKASIVCFTIVASFVILWLPYLIHNLMLLTKVYHVSANSDTFSKVVDHVAYFHAIVDPIIFIWLSRSTKKALLETLKRWKMIHGQKDSRGAMFIESKKQSTSL